MDWLVWSLGLWIKVQLCFLDAGTTDAGTPSKGNLKKFKKIMKYCQNQKVEDRTIALLRARLVIRLRFFGPLEISQFFVVLNWPFSMQIFKKSAYFKIMLNKSDFFALNRCAIGT